MQMTIDTGRLITEVRLRPGLWDESHKSYKDKAARNILWREICAVLNPEYVNDSNRKRQEMEKAVHQRWKTARDAYIRDKNRSKIISSGSVVIKRKKYAYYKELRFLDTRKPCEEEAEDNCDTSESEEYNVSKYNTLACEFVESQNVDSPIEDQDHISDTANTTEIKISERVNNQRKRKLDDDDFDKDMLRLLRDNANMLQNDDLAFFVSFLPVMEKFTIHQKLIFRSEVLKKAMEISGMQNPLDTHCGPTSSAFPCKSEF